MKQFELLIFIICFLAMACKKEALPNSVEDKGILYDTAHFGTKINIREGWGKHVLWGRNADEIFVSVPDGIGANNIYQIDLSTKRSSRIDLTEGSLMGRNFDNSSMLMVGRVNNVYGYYLYHLNTSTFTLLLEVEKTSNHVVNVSHNAIFYFTHKLVSSGISTPCPVNSISCSDWATSVSFLHFIDANSKKIVPLPRKKFHSFSKTGKKTVLRHIDVDHNDSIYIFDNEKGIVTDSLEVSSVDWVYFDDETGIVMEFANGDPTDVIIINAKTKDIIHKFKSSIVYRKQQWSVDGTKIYYSGSIGGTIAMGIYDLISKQELIYNLAPDFTIDMFPSVDNKKILYRRTYATWYIKKVL